MRYFSFFVMAASMLMGTTSFANERGFEFECRLESAKNKGGRCFVRGEVCRDRDSEGCREQLERGDWEATLAVRCTDGFRLFDRRAEVDAERGDLIIAGEKHDNEAVLVIEDLFDNHDRNRDFDATLVTEENGDEAHWAGECEVDWNRPNAE